MVDQRTFSPARRSNHTAPASRQGSWNVAAVMRFFALVLLVAQLGMVAHRIEHYLSPEHMESGEDSCTAFAPTTGAAQLPLFIPPVLFVIFFMRFWTVRDSVVQKPADRLGFRAHAPPL
jgi:hypothetical protein